jgi:membrane-associated phospholipid phosphatase
VILKALRVPVPLLLVAVVLGIVAKTPRWTRADLSISQTIEATRTPWLTGPAQALNIGFGTIGGLVMVATLIVLLLVSGRRRTAGLILAVVIAGWGIGTIFKAAIGRHRPPAAGSLVQQFGNDSFPSGHVCFTLTIVIALALLARQSDYFRAAVVIGALLVLAQMFARIYLGAHYLTDTIGSILVTTAAIHLVMTAHGHYGARLADDHQVV